jgi:hypothetical protein
MLQAAPAAHAEMRTSRLDPMGGSLDDPIDAGDLVGRLLLMARILDTFARQRPFDENRLAREPRHSTRLVIERFNDSHWHLAFPKPTKRVILSFTRIFVAGAAKNIREGLLPGSTAVTRIVSSHQKSGRYDLEVQGHDGSGRRK